MALVETPRAGGLERLTAAVAHSAPWWGFPLVLPALTWGVATLTRRSRYVRQQSLQALAFQAAVTAVLLVLLALAIPFGLFDVLVYAFAELMRLFGTIIAGGFASIDMLAGDFRSMNEVAKFAHPGPFPGNPIVLGALAVVAAALLIAAIGLSLVATVQALRGRPFHYPLFDRLQESQSP
jgi:uncharacterized Tic20 family protein